MASSSSPSSLQAAMATAGGRKREWTGAAASPSDVADSGAAIEQEMKRLRLAYDYSDANALWTQPGGDGDADMEDVGGREDARDLAGHAEYAEANALLREMHFLRQLRKYQAARRVAERQQQQQQQQQQSAMLLRDPRL